MDNLAAKFKAELISSQRVYDKKLNKLLEITVIRLDNNGSYTAAIVASPVPDKVIYAGEIMVTDPETKGEVPLEIYKLPGSGAMVAIESSFLEQVGNVIGDPYNPGKTIEIPETPDGTEDVDEIPASGSNERPEVTFWINSMGECGHRLHECDYLSVFTDPENRELCDKEFYAYLESHYTPEEVATYRRWEEVSKYLKAKYGEEIRCYANHRMGPIKEERLSVEFFSADKNQAVWDAVTKLGEGFKADVWVMRHDLDEGLMQKSVDIHYTGARMEDIKILADKVMAYVRSVPELTNSLVTVG